MVYTHLMTEPVGPVFVQSEPSAPVPPVPLTPEQDRERKIGVALQASRSFLGIVGAGLAKIYREIMMMILKR